MYPGTVVESFAEDWEDLRPFLDGYLVAFKGVFRPCALSLPGVATLER